MKVAFLKIQGNTEVADRTLRQHISNRGDTLAQAGRLGLEARRPGRNREQGCSIYCRWLFTTPQSL